MFVLDPAGAGLLLDGSFKHLAAANWGSIAEVTITAVLGIVALAGGLQGWLLKRTTGVERAMLIIAGLMLAYPVALFDYIGFALLLATAALQKLRRGGTAPAPA